MFNMLPPGYDIRKIPKEVVQAAMKGEMPDLTLLPPDLQQHLRDNLEKMMENYNGAVRHCWVVYSFYICV
ncbi:MAG: hypothetical protein HC785_16435 [Calothrix sp. CSU_2_0]|nr:hypothetical protein [Calothrix sp. CSU_2_0]